MMTWAAWPAGWPEVAGGMGGGMSAMGGMGSGSRLHGRPSKPTRSRTRSFLVSSATELAIRDKNPKSKLIHKKLEEPISMSFTDETAS